jgi:hypothetical protein
MNFDFFRISHKKCGSNPFLKAILFCLTLTILEVILYRDYNIKFFKDFRGSNLQVQFIFIAFWFIEIFLFVLYILVVFRSKLGYKILLFTILLLAVSHEYGYQSAYHRYSTGSDVKIAQNATPEQSWAIVKTYFSFLPLFVIPLFLFFQKQQNPYKKLYGFKYSFSILTLFYTYHYLFAKYVISLSMFFFETHIGSPSLHRFASTVVTFSKNYMSAKGKQHKRELLNLKIAEIPKKKYYLSY